MNKFIKLSIYPTIVMVAVALFNVIYSPVSSAAMDIRSGVDMARGSSQPATLFGIDGIFSAVINILLFVVGALSVIMLIIGGLRYVVSGGNQTAVTGAKNTILYAIVGLVVAILAYAVINFVLSSLVPGASSGGTNV